MIFPNHNFENEIEEQFNIRNNEFYEIANLLLTKKKLINQKEFDVIMWIACNLTKDSVVRKEALKGLRQKRVELRNEQILKQYQKELQF